MDMRRVQVSKQIRAYESSSIRWSPTMTLHRRSGRVAHQTSRRSSSPSQSPSFLFVRFFSSLSYSRPSVVSACLLSLFLSRRRYALLRLHRLFLHEDRIVPASSTFVRARRRLRGPNNTGKTLDPPIESRHIDPRHGPREQLRTKRTPVSRHLPLCLALRRIIDKYCSNVWPQNCFNQRQTQRETQKWHGVVRSCKKDIWSHVLLEWSTFFRFQIDITIMVLSAVDVEKCILCQTSRMHDNISSKVTISLKI